MKTWRSGLDQIDIKNSWEFQCIGGDSGDEQFIARKIVDRGLLFTCHGWLRKLEGFFGMHKVRLIEVDSSDGVHFGTVESSFDHDVAYPRLVGFAQELFDPGV